MARFARLRADGVGTSAAAAATVRELSTDGRTAAATAFAEELTARPETAAAGHLAAAIAGVHRRLPELACWELDRVPTGDWRVHALAEYLEATYQCAPERTTATVAALVADEPVDVPPASWLEVVRYAFATGELALARRAYTILQLRNEQYPEQGQITRTDAEWLASWLDATGTEELSTVAAGRTTFALLDYRQPGRKKTSQNIGDHVQTLAALGHLARHQRVTFRGPQELTEFVTGVQQRVREDRRLYEHCADVSLAVVARDASNYQHVAEGTWLLAFGWYMHPVFGLRHDFPMHPNLRPIFVSFHCNKRELLTDEAVGYLRAYGPVGCRDWTTVDLLLSLEVPAFFSGCVTTTVDTLFPASAPGEDPPLYVDVPADQVPAGAPTARHSYGAVKRQSLVRNLQDAVALLERYRRHASVVTPRLHSHLPARALGLGVDFRPKNRADIRFSGLVDIDDTEFDAIRSGMLARLAAVVGAILAGEPEPEVYRVWREVTAPEVAAARARHDAPPRTQQRAGDAEARARRVRGATAPTGVPPAEPVDVALFVDHDDLPVLPRTLRSMRDATGHRLRVWLLGRGCGAAGRERVAAGCGDLPTTWLACDDLTADETLLLLPHLLPNLDRVAVVPPGAVAVGDVARLAGWQLLGHPLAARTPARWPDRSGFARLYRCTRRLHPDTAAAQELVRQAHARHRFDFDAFETHVLVADLARWRRDEVGERFLPYVREYGMTGAEALHLYAGPDREVLPPRWAHVPPDERVAEPQLVYWPGPLRPWRHRYVPGRQLWTG